MKYTHGAPERSIETTQPARTGRQLLEFLDADYARSGRVVVADAAGRILLTSTMTGNDDAALLEWAGFRVRVVPGESSNFKITSPEDLARAERLVLDLPSIGA